MGCGNSKIDVVQEDPEMAEKLGRFNSYLATLPSLFTETQVDKESFLCTAFIPADFRSMVFACVDTNANYYEKYVPEDELLKTRDRLNVNGSISTWQYLNALKHAFFNNKISLELEHDHNREDSTCKFNIEFNFVTIGTTNLKLRLVKIADPHERIAKVFLNPLYRFYSLRLGAERVVKLESQIKDLENKILALERGEDPDEEEAEVREKEDLQKQVREEPKAPSPSPPEDKVDSRSIEEEPLDQTLMIMEEVQGLTELEDNLVGVPAERILKFLKAIKTKLVANNAITEGEQKSFNQVVDILCNEEHWDIQFSNTIAKEVNMEVVSYLKTKFTVASAEVREKKEKDVVELVPSSEWNSEAIGQNKIREQILQMFDKVDQWDFDVFSIDELTDGHVLFVTAYTLMVKYDFINKFNIPEQILINFLKEVESGYHPNPYHNSMHAADVLQVVHYTIAKGGLADILKDEEIFSVLISAVIHDYDHPGLNNAFLVNAKSYLATLYNDRSVLENHHSAQSFELMKSPQFNIFAGMSTEQRKEIRDTIIDVVLATDMGRHAKLVAKFKGKVENGLDLKKKEDVRLVLQITIKVADVNNTSRPTYLYLKWAQRIVDEFYNQGDKERELELPVTPLMDRTKANMGKGQIAFANYLVIPMFQSYSQLLPQMRFILDYIEDNKRYWEEHETVLPEFLVPRDTDVRHELDV